MCWLHHYVVCRACCVCEWTLSVQIEITSNRSIYCAFLLHFFCIVYWFFFYLNAEIDSVATGQFVALKIRIFASVFSLWELPFGPYSAIYASIFWCLDRALPIFSAVPYEFSTTNLDIHFLVLTAKFLIECISYILIRPALVGSCPTKCLSWLTLTSSPVT